ncbi:WSSV331 [White spot syndrome virus]|uniref:WSSV331 n=1 Tax=White spot syndrome virus TaxID=342409 RepID=A0A2I6SC31_9VIRU|nr:WSSV331 [White spot syndrome virus]
MIIAVLLRGLGRFTFDTDDDSETNEVEKEAPKRKKHLKRGVTSPTVVPLVLLLLLIV